MGTCVGALPEKGGEDADSVWPKYTEVDAAVDAALKAFPAWVRRYYHNFRA